MIPDFPHNIRIRLAQLKFLFVVSWRVLSLLCWLSQYRKAKLRQPTGQRLSNVRVQRKKIQLGHSYSYINRKVWYHQICIQNNIGFMVSDLIFMPVILIWGKKNITFIIENFINFMWNNLNFQFLLKKSKNSQIGFDFSNLNFWSETKF